MLFQVDSVRTELNWIREHAARGLMLQSQGTDQLNGFLKNIHLLLHTSLAKTHTG
jgi:hypothetical protein